MILNSLEGGGTLASNKTPIIYKTSYIGTGTYGVNNPIVLTFDFVPEIIILDYWVSRCTQGIFSSDNYKAYYNKDVIQYPQDSLFCKKNYIICNDLDNDYKDFVGFGGKYATDLQLTSEIWTKRSVDKKTISFYITNSSAANELNRSQLSGGGNSYYLSAPTYYLTVIGYEED